MFHTQYIHIILVTTSASKHHKDTKTDHFSFSYYLKLDHYESGNYFHHTSDRNSWEFLPSPATTVLLQQAICFLIVVVQRNAGGPTFLLRKKYLSGTRSILSLQNHCAQLTKISACSAFPLLFLISHNCIKFLNLTQKTPKTHWQQCSLWSWSLRWLK